MFPTVKPMPNAQAGLLALGAGLSVAAGVGCTFELPEPVDQLTMTAGSGNMAGTGGGDAGPAGGKPNGGSGGTDCEDPQACPSACSEETCQLPNASSECDADGVCRLIACEGNFVDCDGDAENGCEVDFSGTDESSPIVAHELLDEEDLPEAANGDVWAFHPNYSIKAPCVGCGVADSALPSGGPEEAGLSPDKQDLLAVFQAGWSQAGLSFRLQIWDDDRYTVPAPEAGASGEERAKADPRRQDSVEIVYFGLVQGENPRADDHHLYVAFDGRTASTNLKDYDDLVRMTPTETAGGCRISELRLTPNFLSGEDGAANGLIPMLGQLYTFNLGLNDFDREPADTGNEPGPATWQHLVFYKNPMNNYWFNSANVSQNVGELRLEAPAPPP